MLECLDMAIRNTPSLLGLFSPERSTVGTLHGEQFRVRRLYLRR